MPRTARIKRNDAIYHIIGRSISEVDLFKDDEDKEKYLLLIKEAQKTYNFKIYTYCLMDNHVHLIVDANGSDISKVMHTINFRYARYFNTKHKRHGHLFQDRFKSIMVEDDKYLIALSLYIHNNPVEAEIVRNPEDYEFSSLRYYLGISKDEFGIIDKSFILGIISGNKKNSREKYWELVKSTKTATIEEITRIEYEIEDTNSEYRSERKVLVRDFKPEDVIQYVAKIFDKDKVIFHLKHCRDIKVAKSILILLLRNLCNASCKDICKILGNITSARVSKLSSIGLDLIMNDDKYKDVIGDFIACYC